MSAIHSQLPQYAFGGVKRATPGKTESKTLTPSTAAKQQQQAQRPDSEPAAVPGYN